jgi:hypothetical protein
MARRGLLQQKEEVVFFAGPVFSEAVAPCMELVGKGEGATGKATAAEPLRRIEIGEIYNSKQRSILASLQTQGDRLK